MDHVIAVAWVGVQLPPGILGVFEFVPTVTFASTGSIFFPLEKMCYVERELIGRFELSKLDLAHRGIVKAVLVDKRR